MVKKRELTVEVWNRWMNKERELMRTMGADTYIDLYAARGVDVEEIVFENQMAKAWERCGKQVYDFDRDFANSIVNEKWLDLLPDCIKYRPHDCFYMKLPCEKNNEGVVVNIVPLDNVINFEPELFPGYDERGVHFGGNPAYGTRVMVNTGDEIFTLCSFAVSKTPELMTDDTPIELYPVDLVANGVAYLCSTNADITPVYKPQKNLRRNNAKKRSEATWSEVGYRIGAELRAYNRTRKESGEHAGGTVRPHMRRAHWHHYWTGSKKGERKLTLKWVAPVMVGVGIKSATSHKVR